MTEPVKYGLYYFAVSAGITLLLYLVNTNLIFNPTLSLLMSFGLPILFIILSIKADRADEPGYSMAEGIKAGMITFAIGTLLGALFTYILANVIDPTLGEKAIEFTREVAVKTAETMGGLLGADEAEKAKMVEEVGKQELPNPFSMTQLGLGWVISLIFPGLIISLIAAAILKKS
ncbi:DUF4199 domain-containing protein [Portibacter marinus]|uniref:DUF4199 domain-containing protein n=1 Tax=Portibacter marinus TaxID=2898660 RepID=UPI001F37AC5C|nr:DUF4199 domain-containing protein [Portibacter marinus]